ncbi:aminotransferase class IV [Winogradskyella echinorum]|uniref:branched-chain-amino-acid transaminase n=1 Tax=Winogradskyella echinorum TaxID=538189 RepID=A0ABR6Y523_9FLAO|nr:aminotransferase class IV [Winogradskyella echinorum]MBC3847853.1 aminotransferase class IV [Winogradskyella echinorum]MBC5752201.1 aminotransferase class IV [Winogradskyella echinorum]
MVHGTHNALEDSRNNDILISINDQLFPRNEAKISVFDSGYLVGDGVWEALRLHQGVLVFLEDHFNRLWQSAATVGMHLPFTKEELTQKVWNTLNANKMTDGVHVRIMVTRGIKKTPSQDPRLTISGPNVVIIPEYKTASKDSKEKGITLFTSTIRRGSPDYLDPRLNCHSKLHEVQALIQAIQAGADEALMLDINGFVATCNATNFFIIKNDEVWTSTSKYCMNGITRAKVLEVCKANKIPCYEKDFSLFDVYGADEAFVTGTFGGLTPVTKIDGRQIGDGNYGKMTSKLSALYKDLIENTVSNG